MVTPEKLIHDPARMLLGDPGTACATEIEERLRAGGELVADEDLARISHWPMPT